MSSLKIGDEPVDEIGAAMDLGRQRMPRTSNQSDDMLDWDDLPDEDDFLSDIPEDRRLKRILEIQQPFQEEGLEPYASSCRIPSKVFDVPISLVSLIYEHIQWFKASVGVDINHTLRCWSFCSHTFTPERPEVLYVPDPLLDPRFCENELVQFEPKIRFYCGVPLVTQDGVRLGALCIIDRKPRSMCENAFQFMINVAELTVRELMQSDIMTRYKPSRPKNSSLPVPSLNPNKLRRIPGVNQQQKLREAWFERGLSEGAFFIDASEPVWHVLWTNSQWDTWCKHAKIIGSVHPKVWSVLRPVDYGTTDDEIQNTILEKLDSSGSGSCSFLARVVGLGGQSSIFVSCDVAISTKPINDVRFQIRMPSNQIVPPTGAEPIVFDGSKILIVFVKPVPESMASATDKATESEVHAGSADDMAGATTVNTAVAETQRGELVEAVATSTDSQMSTILSVFQSYDKEKTGRIRRSLLEKVISRLSFRYQVDLPEDKIKLLLDHLDQDGFIKYKEFCAALLAPSR